MPARAAGLSCLVVPQASCLAVQQPLCLPVLNGKVMGIERSRDGDRT